METESTSTEEQESKPPPDKKPFDFLTAKMKKIRQKKKKKKGEETDEEEEDKEDDGALDSVDVVHISKYRMQRRVLRGGPVVDLEAGVVKDRKLTDPAFIVIFALCICGMV